METTFNTRKKVTKKRMRYIKLFFMTFCLLAGISGAVIAQTGNPATSGKFVLKNDAGNSVTLAVPSSGVTNYTLTFPTSVGAAGTILYLTNGAGSAGWLSPGAVGQVLSTNTLGLPVWVTPNLGTVTSVGLSMPSIFTVTNSPITLGGTLTATLATESANVVFAGPSSGSSAAPTFRALVVNDIPDLSADYIVNGTTLQTGNYNISGNGTIGGKLQLTGTSTGVTTFQAGAQGNTNIAYTLPLAQGAANTVLLNDGSGNLSWSDQSSLIGAVKFAIKGSDQSISNSTTLTNDKDLYFSIGANETWEIVVQLDVTATGAEDDGDDSPNLFVAVTIPSGTLHVYANGDGGDNDRGDWLTTSGSPNEDAYEVNDENSDGPVVLQGIIAGGSTGGTVHIQWAPDS